MRILVVEDEIKIAAAIKRGLELSGYAVDTVHDAITGFNYGMDSGYDLIVLDRMLPGGDGLDICKRLRDAKVQTPILLLTARGTIGDKVQGLNYGADDYLVKPFSFDELTARIRALLRRPAASQEPILKVADVELDPLQFTVHRAGKAVKLSQKEFLLLEYFMRHAGQILSKDTLIAHIWNEDADILPNTVEVYIGYLRTKLDRAFPERPPLLHTVRGFGYKLDETPS